MKYECFIAAWNRHNNKLNVITSNNSIKKKYIHIWTLPVCIIYQCTAFNLPVPIYPEVIQQVKDN